MRMLWLLTVLLLLTGAEGQAVQKALSWVKERVWPQRQAHYLELIKEAKFDDLVRKTKGLHRYEASGVTHIHGSDELLVVIDNIDTLVRIDPKLEVKNAANVLVENAEKDWRQHDKSDFESITYCKERGTYLIAIEGVSDDAGDHTHTIEVVLRDDGSFEILEECYVELELTHLNKGIESVSYAYDENTDTRYLWGMCEGNHCTGGKKGREKGNGRIVVSMKTTDHEGRCMWRTDRIIKLPRQAAFEDYATFRIHDGRFYVISQADSAMWVGKFCPDCWWTMWGRGRVYYFPRLDGQVVYCNVEGLTFVTDEAGEERLFVVSDRYKRGGGQPRICGAKEMSAHTFRMPE